uniref:C2H2-type domain-containing protein n=1 Tax=Neogobius melanostomus TaxID=47308 RepID=A0A8C6TWA3_9GOBI
MCSLVAVAREPPQKKTPPPPPKICPPPKPRPHVTLPRPRPEKAKAAVVAAFVQKGEVSHRRPPNCTVCMSPYKLVPELRGFVCMCSSDISSALQILKLRRKDERVKSRLKEKLNLLNQKQRVSKPQPFHSYAASKNLSSLQKPLRASEHFLSEPRRSVSPGLRPRPSVSPGVPRPRPSPSPGALVRSEVSSPGSGGEVTVGGAVGRLVIRLEDFYYGCAEGEGAVEQVRLVTTYRCMHCAQVLPNNVSMMQHTRDHMKKNFRGYCPHCFRQFFSSLKLQRHLEMVHGPDSCSSRVVCRICEFEFEDEVSLLLHMKNFHKPGEMPYACALCGFRSSFFSQTWRHFEDVHANTRHFMCQYCLRVFKMDRSYQQHVTRHLRKQVYSCDRCRLHFHVAKDRQDHQEQHHGTHVRPAQLSGLRPGTTVSVRTYQVAPPESPVQTKPIAALTKAVLKVHPKQQKACKRSAVESMGQLLAQLHSPECCQCVECLSRFQDFQSHFPTRVTCSRCHFQTCCSRAYANHMIDNHSGKRSCLLYPQVFTSSPRLDCNLECLTCGFSCQTGDAMARHLSKNTKHTCLLTDRAEEELTDEEDDQSSVGGMGGFISIERLSSSHLSITTLDRPAHLSSRAAMTITVRGPSHPLAKPAAPLAVSRLSVLLHSLLHGAVSASKLFGVVPSLIGRWAREQRKTLTNRRWCWDTTAGAHWVLTEREQNRIVTLEAILDLCRRTLGTKAPLQARLNWAVDFLLRHDLGVETRSKELRDIGYSVVTSTWDKVSSLVVIPSRFCCLDEFPVFMDTTTLSSLAHDALRVWGSREELPLVEVLLCGTSDGSLLPPMLFYNKELPPLPHGFPTNIILQARDGGYSPGERAQLWTEQVWLPHLRDSAPSLLLLDEHCGHMTPDFTEPLRRLNTELVYIPRVAAS